MSAGLGWPNNPFGNGPNSAVFNEGGNNSWLNGLRMLLAQQGQQPMTGGPAMTPATALTPPQTGGPANPMVPPVTGGPAAMPAPSPMTAGGPHAAGVDAFFANMPTAIRSKLEPMVRANIAAQYPGNTAGQFTGPAVNVGSDLGRQASPPSPTFSIFGNKFGFNR